jgi:hypothetical protein
MRTSTRMIYGAGIDDFDGTTKKKGCPFHRRWRNLIARVYSGSEADYEDCEVCCDWLTFSKFRDWMASQDWDGKELDKDILHLGNLLYSPERCAFVDPRLNRLFRRYPNNKSGLPRGVSKQARFVALEIVDGKRVEIGRFDDPISAHFAWVTARMNTLIEIASTQSDPIRSAIINRANRLQWHIENCEEVFQI